MEKIFLKTKDGAKIAANYQSIDVSKYQQPTGWCILIHMMPATKESWQDFADELQKQGYESLAIDLRGHGESDGGPTGYLNFSDQEHQKSILDIEAAVNYLKKERKAAPDKIILMGASIGANLALQYIVNPPAGGADFKTAILFSPGLNYRGIETEPLVKNLKAGQRVLFISAKDDKRAGGDNAAMNQKLYHLTPAGVKKQMKIYEIGGHGTDILKIHPELKDKIIEFLK